MKIKKDTDVKMIWMSKKIAYQAEAKMKIKIRHNQKRMIMKKYLINGRIIQLNVQ